MTVVPAAGRMGDGYGNDGLVWQVRRMGEERVSVRGIYNPGVLEPERLRLAQPIGEFLEVQAV